ncbi:MAG TPA: DNA-binding response regulator [Nitrospira sp.]|nr:DNA-binding response regulator [Nitrospira sp.]
MRILLVEDDADLAQFIRKGLKEERYAVDVASNGEQGFELGIANPYDLIILDIMLPVLDGLSLCRRLRDTGVTAPVLLLTARDTVQDKVSGLDMGADDYLTKPFDFDELLARVAALTRRRSGSVSGVLHFGNLQVDRLNRQVRVGHRRVELSPREFRLLEHFMLHPEQVVTRVQLLQQVWDMSFDPETNMIDAHISNLRKKLERYGDPRLLQTIRGAGYALRLGDE